MLSKKLTWKLGFIAVVVLFALLASYPPQEKVIRVEEVTEKYEYGQWVEGEKKVVKRSLLAFLMTSRDERVSVEREYEKGGAKYRVKRVEHVVPGKIKLGSTCGAERSCSIGSVSALRTTGPISCATSSASSKSGSTPRACSSTASSSRAQIASSSRCPARPRGRSSASRSAS